MALLSLVALVCFAAVAYAGPEDDSGDVYWGYIQTEPDYSKYPIAKPKEMACYPDDLTWEAIYTKDSGLGYCDQMRQSPININTDACVDSDTSLGAFTFTDYDTATTSLKAHNNGHGIGMSPEDDTAAVTQTISGGGLPKTYKFAQFHVHWGPNDVTGSEHTMDAMSAPLELHIVHYDAAFDNLGLSLAEPSTNGDNLAVLGVMYEIDDSVADIAYLTSMIDSAAAGVDTVGGDATFGAITLADLLPENTEEFYRYEGSLTTPTCNEEVQWTVFANKVKVNSAQMENLRMAFKYSSGQINRINYRPPQPLNGRLVKASFGSSVADATECALTDVGAASTFHISAILLALSALVAVFYH